MTVGQYVSFYDKTWAAVIKKQDRYPLQEYAERSILTTWRMSYDMVESVEPQAARLLDQWAFLHSGDIWYELAMFCPHAPDQDSAPRDTFFTATDELSFLDALSVLSQYSLVIANEGVGFSIHPVVHSWCLYNIVTLRQREQLCSKALSMVTEMVPLSEGTEDLSIARRLVPHARTSATRYLSITEDESITYELHTIADFVSDWERSNVVENLYLRALKGKEKAWGADHTSTLDTVNNLGNLYKNLGRTGQAEEMYLRALKGKEKAWGADHTSTLNTVNNLGNLYKNLGRTGQAEEMYLRALKGKEKAWGADHTSTLDTVNNLGNLYTDLGRIGQAEDMYLRALKGKEKAWGADHISTLHTVNNLGNLYADLGRTGQAEEMYIRALIGYKASPLANKARISALERWCLTIEQDQGVLVYLLRPYTFLNLTLI